MYNDTIIKGFEDWIDVVRYCLESQCVPTVIFYEKKERGKKSSPKDSGLYLSNYSIQELE
jgi:hypothetical protein